MNNILTECIKADREYSQLLDMVNKNFKNKPLPMVAGGLCEGANDALCFALCEDTKAMRNTPMLVICSEEKECLKLLHTAERFGLKAAFYISRDLTFYNITASHEYEHERLKVLTGIVEKAYDIVFTTPDTTLGYTTPPEILKKHTVYLDYSYRAEPSDISKILVDAGYTRVDMVEGPGQFSARGGIVDIYPPFGKFVDVDKNEHNGAFAFRLEFFDDEIDRMAFFDVESQRMSLMLDCAEITPARELLITDESRANIGSAVKAQYKNCKVESVKQTLSSELATIGGGGEIGFADKYITLVYPEKKTILDYFDSRSLVLIRSGQAVNDRLKSSQWQRDQTIKDLLEGGSISSKYTEYSARNEVFASFCEKNVTLFCDSLSYGMTDRRLSGLFGFRTKHPVSYSDNYSLLCEDISGYIHGGYKVIIMTENAKTAKNLDEMLREADFKTIVENDDEQLRLDMIPAGVVGIVWKEFLFGFELFSPRIVVLSTNTDAKTGSLNVSRNNKTKRQKKNTKTILSYNELSVGDIVVHETYGIGKYLGIEKLKIDGVCRDYISIQYAGDDKLCMPVEKMDMVSKYIGAHSDDGLIKLSKMGSDAWKRTTARAKGAVKEMAKDLIKLYAERMRKPGFAFDVDDEIQKDFENSFDYVETDCQLDAINDIKRDMMKPVPMDRLLCGDVGYGKTEVAFRAAFKAVLNGKQVAILCPTTILALQHYQTAVSRMRNYSVNVDMLSRFRTQKQQSQIMRRLERGDIDIIIGTHKLLGKDIKFKDLGLLIVDEEQRFGVAQKEKLKQLSGNIDVLTLTATPIPRTLNMAMGGIRDISLLDEAPGDRLPVQTYVLEYDELIIMEAIRKELRRGGQVFYLHNFIESIDMVANRLAKEIPDARITVAHGRMDKEQLEEIWGKMLSGQIDILVSTTIIETGVDIPNANTLIVDRADRLGLSQLHQIRGRVGRSSRRAYAYFTYPENRAINEIAQKRLEAIRDYTEFGAGFRIAMRDMEIRGAGNLLGGEQHGHLDAVGYDMYIRLLNDAVLEEKGEKPKERVDCTVSLDFDAFLPDTYVRYPAHRMALYKRIALIRTQEDVDDIADELLDRFGELPVPADNLLRISLIRSLAMDCDIRQLTQHGNEVRMYQDKLDFEMWSYMSEITGGKVSLITGQGKDSYALLRLKSGENALAVINKMFEKYIEIVQRNEKKSSD